MIFIHWDYTDGSEISYAEGQKNIENNNTNFNTNVLEFFSTETPSNVVVLKRDGSYIDRNELMSNKGNYTLKEMRTAHNIQRMLVAGAFKWREPRS